jgi:hypothetical protein
VVVLAPGIRVHVLTHRRNRGHGEGEDWRGGAEEGSGQEPTEQ